MANLTGLGGRLISTKLNRAGVDLRSIIQRHATELSTGQSSDPAQRLRGEVGSLHVIESRLTRIAAQDQSLLAFGQRLGAVGVVVGQISDLHERLRATTISTASAEPPQGALDRLAALGRQTLEDMIGALSRSHAGHTLLSGDRPDRQPLVSAGTMLQAAASAMIGVSSAQGIAQRVAELFFDSGGLFETNFYTGGPPIPAPAFTADGGMTSPPTAADPALRGALASAVLVAMIGASDVVSSIEMRRDIAKIAAHSQVGTAESLIDLSAGLGLAETSAADRRVRLTAEREALELAREARIGVDPYEAAVRLEDARVRLEAVLLLTARVSRLSLTEFLR